MNLEDLVTGRALIIGIGNRQRGDDGVGPVLVDRLKKEGFQNVLDAGSVPENYTKFIIEYSPDTIILIDALAFGGKPGEFKVITTHTLDEFGFSTHNASLKLLITYISQFISVNFFLLGIQPATIDFKDSLSQELEQTINQLVDKFTFLFKRT